MRVWKSVVRGDSGSALQPPRPATLVEVRWICQGVGD
jgi:hypothetical protein